MLIVSSDIRYINIGLDLRMRIIVNRREKYHLFFHKKENHSLHQLLSADLCETLKPYMEKKLYKMKEKGLTDAACIPMAASFLLYGASPVILDDGYSTEDKADGIRGFMERVLKSR